MDQELAPLPENPTPQDFGFPSNPTSQQLTAWRNQERFLLEYRKHGRLNLAAETAGVTVWAVDRWDYQDLYSFKRRKAEAYGAVLERLEAEADRRAIEGTDKPIIYQGRVYGTYKEYSDNLLMFRMKRLDPSYRDNYQHQTVNDNRQVNVTYNFSSGPRSPDAIPSSSTPSIVDADYQPLESGTESATAPEIEIVTDTDSNAPSVD